MGDLKQGRLVLIETATDWPAEEHPIRNPALIAYEKEPTVGETFKWLGFGHTGTVQSVKVEGDVTFFRTKRSTYRLESR